MRSPKARPKSMNKTITSPTTSKRPPMRPDEMENSTAPTTSPPPRMRPKGVPLVGEGSTRSPDNINMNERAARGELTTQPRKNPKRKMPQSSGGDRSNTPPKLPATGMNKAMKAGGMMKKGYKAGGKMPDLSGDGKVTQKDVLMGRGVIKKKAGGMMKKGYKAGGKMKKGYKKGGKVRGAGIARKGVRAARMI